ncbi:MAG: TRAP transporter substrate-binding protein [Rhizobiaceae bacterium]|nr:TRAP transporter substrate-binding protein [Rhizobiaceae bacterium]
MFARAIIAAAFAASLVLPATAASWDLANEYPANSLQGQAVDVFAKAVSDKTGGTVTITVHHGGALGYKSVDHFDAVGDGALQAASSAFSSLPGIDPIFQLSALPFLVRNADDAWRLYEAGRPEYDKVFADNNQLLLFATPWPASGLWGNKAFNTPEDLEGVKVRTSDVASTETLRSAGAFPVQVSWADVPGQLSTGGIDAVLTSANGGIGVRMWELQSHFTAVNYASSLQGLHANLDAWNALTEEEQKAVREAAAEAEAFVWGRLGEISAGDFETLRSNGMTVVESVSPEFSDFLKAAAKPVIDDWIAKTGERAKRVMDAYEGSK